MTAHQSFAYEDNRNKRALRHTRSVLWYDAVKRCIDIGFVLASAPLAVPIVGLLALAVRLDGGPVFFHQERIGKDGRRFRMWKLRTMVVDGERALAGYLSANPEAAREWHETQKLRSDPRITPVGRFIRRHSIDELPQLWNVLVGDMSLVGPRPMLPDQMALYPGEDYYAMRPGLTGLWQVGARNDSSFASRAAYDSLYAQTRSLSADIAIMFRTVGVVLRGTGI